VTKSLATQTQLNENQLAKPSQFLAIVNKVSWDLVAKDSFTVLSVMVCLARDGLLKGKTQYS
jgi:hypothetical protein